MQNQGSFHFSLWIMAILILTSFIGCHSNSSMGTQSPAGLINNIGDMTIAIMSRGEDELTASAPICTGIFIREDVIMTAGHCIDHFVKEQPLAQELKDVNIYWMTRGEVTNVQEEPHALYLGHPIANDKEKDLGLIRVRGMNIPRHKVAKIAEMSPEIGEKLHSIGHVSGLYWSHVYCYVSRYQGPLFSMKGPFLQIEGIINHGNSGGGIFNEKGDVVGIVSFLHKQVPGMSFAVHLDNIKMFLRDNLK